MAMQRANPLPVGRYEKDLFGAQVEQFTKWLDDYGTAVLQESAEFIPPLTSGTHSKFYVFQAVPWPDGLGFPDISEDKSPAPVWPYSDPPSKVIDDAEKKAGEIVDKVEKAGESAASAVKTGLIVGGLGLLGYLLAKVLG